MKELGVIILNWNGLELLKKFLPAAARHTVSERSDLIVADNGSSDESVAWIRKNHPEVIIIELDKNYGFAEGYNRAIAQTDYRYVTLLNSDVEVKGGWWQPILDFMISNPDVGAVQPKIMSYAHPDSFEYAGAAGGYLDNLGYPYCRGRLFDKIEEDHGQYDGKPAEVAWASGACITVPSDLYKKVGGLDSLFFAHMEEIDLCLRIIAAGYKVCSIPNSKVWHVGGASLNQGNPQKTYLNFRNNLLLLHKNMPVKAGKKKIFLRRLTDTLAWGMFILKGDFKNANAVLKAHHDFRRMRKEYTQHPTQNIFEKLPGADKSALMMRYLGRK